MVLRTRPRKQTLISLLLLLLQTGLFLLGTTIIFYLLFGLFELFIGGSNFMKDFPVVFSFNEVGQIFLPNQVEGYFNMDGAIGKISINDLPKSFIAMFGFLRLLQLMVVFFVIKFTVKILKTAKNGQFFIRENALLLRKIAYLGITLYFVEVLSTLYSSYYFSDKLQFSGVEFVTINGLTFFDFQTIIFSLFLLIISEAFRIGAELQEDVDLSI